MNVACGVRSAECGIVAEFIHSSLKNGKTAEMQAVQGVVSTPTGVYIDVHEQGARSNNEEMRSIYVVCKTEQDASKTRRARITRGRVHRCT